MTDFGSDSDRDPANRGYRRLFDGDLTVGLSFPITTDDEPLPSGGFDDQFGRARYAADLGFDALWVRDVPTFWPEFGDAGQIHDPFVHLSEVAARTEDVALGTASVALPLRHPLHVAKAAASIDRLSGGRLVLGVGTGDRPPEYAAFGVDREARGERFRESVRVLRAAWGEAFPEVGTSRCRLEGDLDVVPKPETGTVPLLVTGRSRQSLEWIAERGDGWLNYQLPLDTLEATVGDWRAATARRKPYAATLAVHLDSDPTADATPIHQGFAAGADWFRERFAALADRGVDHVIVSFRGDDRPVRDVLEEFGTDVLGSSV